LGTTFVFFVYLAFSSNMIQFGLAKCYLKKWQFLYFLKPMNLFYIRGFVACKKI
jgi:hypothetical protein